MVNWKSRAILGALSLFLVCIVIVIVVLGLQVRREGDVISAHHTKLKEQLAEVREERMEKEAYLRSFLKDRDFVERVVRERLGYVEPGETLFRFEN